MKINYYSWDIREGFDYPSELKNSGFRVDFTDKEETFIENIISQKYDLYIFDTTNVVNYRKIFQYLKETRKIKDDNFKLLFFLAITDLKDDFILDEALSFGLTDYIYNKLTPKQFVAKISSIDNIFTSPRVFGPEDVLRAGDLELNYYTRVAKRSGNVIHLTNKEFLLLELLLRNKNKVVTRNEIYEKIWNDDLNAEKNIGDVYVTFLRRKLEYGYPTKIIKTIRNVGYIIKD